MCELLAMSTHHTAQLTVSLEALAGHSGPAGGTRDGWGVAYFQGRDVALFREPSAASDSPLVRWLGQSGPATTLVIAHIRRATLGTVALSNTQPFVRELGGRAHVFAHNGHLPGIARSQELAFDRYRPILFRLSPACGVAQHPPSAQSAPVALAAQALTLIASVPLDGRQWQPFAEGEVVVVSAGRTSTQTNQSAPGASPDDERAGRIPQFTGESYVE